MYDFKDIPEDQRFYFLAQWGDDDPEEDSDEGPTSVFDITEEEDEEDKAQAKRANKAGYGI